tara:strand:+ start:1210 stop:2190 length:981 start_codon:yes stop_codon:yes gene_type:complete
MANKEFKVKHGLLVTDGKVGIGTTSPGDMNDSANDLVIGSGASSDNIGLTIFSNSNASGSIHFADGTSGADAYKGYIYYTHAQDFMGLGTAGAERIRITGAGNVGVGTTAPANVLQVKTAVDGSGLTIQRDSTTVGTYAQLSFTNTTTDNYTAPTWIRTLRDSGGVNASPMTFGTAGAEKLRIQSGGGISFNGDTAATNALDDYEEGTWTPTIASGGSVTSTSARYTKIGNIVRATARLSNFSFTNVDGTALQIGGLPYSMHSDSNVGFAWGNTGSLKGRAVYFWSGSGGGSNMYAYWSGSSYDSTTHNEVPSGFNLLINLVYGHG